MSTSIDTIQSLPRTRATTSMPAQERGSDSESRGGAVAAREADLLRVLHDQHARALWAYVVRLTNGDGARAEDVVQETLLRAWRHPQVLDQSRGSARAWLFTVARRIVIDDWRSRSSHLEVVTADPPDRPVADATDRTVDTMIMTAALSRLSPDHRAVLRECYQRGASVAQAAQTLGVPPGTIKSRTHYALRALRVALQEMGGLQ
jgi:RNA polymerase sigma-70 factor (ECF subfamily)